MVLEKRVVAFVGLLVGLEKVCRAIAPIRGPVKTFNPRAACDGSMPTPIEVTTVPDFRREVERSSEPTVVMFTTSWCPFCRRFKPKFVEAATKADVRSVIAYIDDWENPLWDEYTIDVVPTLVLFEGGKPVYRRDGVLGRGLGEKDLRDLLAHAPQAVR